MISRVRCLWHGAICPTSENCFSTPIVSQAPCRRSWAICPTFAICFFTPMISRVRCLWHGAICPTLQGYTSIRTWPCLGALPRAFVRLNLTDLLLGGTQLCIPPDAGFQRWLQGIPNRRVPTCSRSDGPQAYLTQATQSLTHPVPLVAGKPALLRVFVATDKDIDVSMPPVRATFYRNGTWVHTADIPRRGNDGS